jgi:hypothetical protein
MFHCSRHDNGRHLLHVCIRLPLNDRPLTPQRYSMDVTARTNPLQKYIGKSAKANIHVRPCPKGTLVADVAGRVISEGTPFERTVEDELSD